MEITIIDCMFVIDYMGHLNKSLKLKCNITYDVSPHDREIQNEGKLKYQN